MVSAIRGCHGFSIAGVQRRGELGFVIHRVAYAWSLDHLLCLFKLMFEKTWIQRIIFYIFLEHGMSGWACLWLCSGGRVLWENVVWLGMVPELYNILWEPVSAGGGDSCVKCILAGLVPLLPLQLGMVSPNFIIISSGTCDTAGGRVL
ncbi:hypothetical protein OIU78_027210 [Salix suchowensis]|nr:hypothetical protein OIU78_027210 [Salix suchowensis]